MPITNEKGLIMNLAKISTNGQVTIPIEVRRSLNLNTGDKLIFVYNKKGEVVLQKLNVSLFNTQEADEGITDAAIQ